MENQTNPIHVWYPKDLKNDIEKTYLRVQKEQFSEEKGFILRYTEKKV